MNLVRKGGSAPAWVWYAGYGSNLDRDRFGHYVTGGAPPGARRAVPGCRDRTPPRAEQAVELPGEVYFAWQSPTWGGGVAFFRPDRGKAAYARAYLLTAGQFADIVAQEMHRQPETELDLARVLGDARSLGEENTLALGPGRYETVCRVGTIEDIPVVTFTAASDDHARMTLNAPAAAYLQTVCKGLGATFAWSPQRIAAYLAQLPGVAPTWDLDTITRLAADVGQG